MSALPGAAPAPDTRWRPWPGHAAVSKPPCTGAPGQPVTGWDEVRAYALARGYLRWYRPGEIAP